MRYAQRWQRPFTMDRKEDTTVHRCAVSAPCGDLFTHIIAEFTGMLVAPFRFHEGKMVHGRVKFVIDHAQLCKVSTVVHVRYPTPQFVPVKRVMRPLNPDLRVAWMSSPCLLSFPTNRPRCGGKLSYRDARWTTGTTRSPPLRSTSRAIVRRSKAVSSLSEVGNQPSAGRGR